VDVGVRRGDVNAARGTLERSTKEAARTAGGEGGRITIEVDGVVVTLWTSGERVVGAVSVAASPVEECRVGAKGSVQCRGIVPAEPGSAGIGARAVTKEAVVAGAEAATSREWLAGLVYS
jgi:hypothetical protein